MRYVPQWPGHKKMIESILKVAGLPSPENATLCHTCSQPLGLKGHAPAYKVREDRDPAKRQYIHDPAKGGCER